MGWVAEKFKAYAFRPAAIAALWNETRDAIGLAVDEFNEEHGPGSPVTRKDCKSKSRFCVRLERADGRIIEVFLEEEPDGLSTQQSHILCGFRPTRDIQSLEYYDRQTKELLTTEETTRKAIEGFLFAPVSKRPESAPPESFSYRRGGDSPFSV